MRGGARPYKHIYVFLPKQRQLRSGNDTQLGFVYLYHCCFIYLNPGSNNLVSMFCWENAITNVVKDSDAVLSCCYNLDDAPKLRNDVGLICPLLCPQTFSTSMMAAEVTHGTVQRDVI